MLQINRWKVTLTLVFTLIVLAMALPNLLSKEQMAKLPSFLPSNQVVLGLDLQGGSHLLLQVDTDAVVSEQLENARDDARQRLRETRIGYTNLSIDRATRIVSGDLREISDLEQAKTVLAELSQPLNNSVLAGGGSRTALVSVSDAGKFTIMITEEAIADRISNAVSQSMEVIRRRVDDLGTTEPLIQQQGADRILVQVPGLDDPERLKALIGSTAKMTFHLADTSIPIGITPERVPVGSILVLGSEDEGGFPYVLQERPIVTGEDLVDAQPGFDQRTNEPIVTFRFNGSGARRFGQVTTQNTGQIFAIVLDNEVISAPRINEPITGGSGQISGNFTVQSANDLAVLLRAGALPAPLTIVEERTVGAGLGADSIKAGQLAAIVGMVGVLVFMFMAYGLFGLFANVAVLVNVTMIFGILSAIGATLTLPGIAGIVLTVGMAVDANVLIYERIREEARAGKSAIASIDAGFSRALGTILDANITTFIAALTLFFLGAGPIKGFAVTLAVGILTTIFTAFMLTRLMVAFWVAKKRPKTLPL